MKLRIPHILLMLLLAVSVNTIAQDARAKGSRRSYTVYAPDSSLDKIYNEGYGEYPYYVWHDWHHHSRRFYRRRYKEDRRYYDYYYDRSGRYQRNHDRYDDDRYYYRGGGY